MLGTEGLRALTHVRVDERAGLPKGPTSNHFRTREALLLGVVDWIAARELPSVGAAFAPAAAAEAIAACCEGLILHRIARHDTSDPRPIFELLVNSLIPA